MDHNLEDSLNLEGAIENMDFDHSGVVINQGDITFESNESVIKFEDQQMLMDTGNEEIIVTDFMGDQFTFQEYSVQDKPTSEQGAAVELNQMTVISQADAVLDLQLDSENVTQSFGQGISGQQKFIAVKAGLSKTLKKNEMANIPKQVAIAPKPSKPKQPQVLEKATFASGKQYSIAPKPVALLFNKNFKKVSLAGVQGNIKGNTVWAPLGKKVLMAPADAAQKIKFVPSSKSVSSTQMAKPVMAKVIVQGGQSGVDVVNPQGVVPTKIIPAISAAGGAHYVMQPKTVPVSFARNKVLVGSPTKEGLRFSKKQIIAIKSPTSKLVPAATQGATTKRVVITTNPNQNVILKSTGSSKVARISKESSGLVLQGQHTQLHQVNVPGKGIQFIRLVTTNPSTQAVTKAPPPKPGSWGPLSSHGIALPSKSFVLTDSKGNIIQMTAEKMVTSQPPPLVITGTPATSTTTCERKLVRIAPVTSKSGQLVTQTVRSTQSLLAPLSTMTNTKVTIDDTQNANKTSSIDSAENPDDEEERYSEVEDENHGMKQEQQDLSDTVADEQNIDDESEVHEITVYDQKQVQAEDTSNDMDKQYDNKGNDDPLIVIPSNFRQPVYSDGKRINNSYSDEDSNTSILEEQKSFAAMVNVETEITSYESSRTPEAPSENVLVDTNMVPTELGLRPRKACNCTKSQCLKLYCDCFANGEFCNNCNCNNCHNNLENEELRQRAIRACLERNPYAFRPKIGKSKTGGPDIIRRHNKGCNCKRSGCLKNYCECYEAKIACTSTCKCVGCRNVEETMERRRELRLREKISESTFRPPVISQVKQPCSFMTTEVIEAVCQCLIAAAAESEGNSPRSMDSADDDELEPPSSPVRDVIDEFARCLQEIIGASHQALPQPEQEQQTC